MTMVICLPDNNRKLAFSNHIEDDLTVDFKDGVQGVKKCTPRVDVFS